MTALDPHQNQNTRHPSAFDESDAHLLRLCLDLQLDALLLALGAASAQELRDQGTPASGADRGADDVVPWRRWVEEDVDLAAGLAADAMAGRATLPPTLGTDLGHEVPAAVIDNLVARYESMHNLLGDLLRRDLTVDDDHRHPRVLVALRRCRARLDELHRYRLATTPPRGVRLDAAVPVDGPTSTRDREYLPGELLG
ncbi:hypothetical protein [Kineosporia sp. R_H_3]|uniref:hypothetical protein n=1 Tax=Kineosporia sp. R_H_3 TaxID=1961848 RepID=UPI000B4AC4E2|nr:hypothetical protein [Kineosporia sp. R_H_3]